MVLSGCATIEDAKYRAVNRSRANDAWREARACMSKECANHDFADGFKEGYFAVATGSGSCPPVVPPPKYFHTRISRPKGNGMSISGMPDINVARSQPIVMEEPCGPMYRRKTVRDALVPKPR